MSGAAVGVEVPREPRYRAGVAPRADLRKTGALYWRSRLQAALILVGMLLLVGVLAALLFGELFVVVLVMFVSMGLLATPRLTPGLLLRFSGARRLHPAEAPELHHLLYRLSERADLERAPALYWLPRGLLNAFAVGTSDDAAVVVSEGLLRTLHPRELAGVLAHELAHVRSGDLRVMLLAEIVARITGSFASIGVFLLLLNLPLALSGAQTVSWWAVLLLIAAPSISLLLQLGLSRSRERAADLEAVRLTGDPRALASALQKIHRHQERSFENLLFRHRHGAESPWLRTHPVTEERIQTLLALETPPPRSSLDALLSDESLFSLVGRLPVRRQRSYYIR